MNILIPHLWLKEHLKTQAKPADMQKYLSLSGPSVERLYDKTLSDGQKDIVYDIEVTTNRVDMMSVAGIAREAATILKRAGFEAELSEKAWPKIIPNAKKKLPLPEIVYKTEAVKRVLCVVLSDLKNQPSPSLIQDRLQEIEVNVHDAIIDISNYITHELGHPCHVFDYDKIMALGGKIIIEEARVGKKFVTLDEVEHETLGGEIVFTNPQGEIIDLPAIKGTLNSGVDDQTTRILFWIESLDPKKVRQASMGHAIRTVAAQLNEKNVDPHLADSVLAYGVSLFQKLAQAKVASAVYDYFPNPGQEKTVLIDEAEIEAYLGIKIPSREIKSILEDLGCLVKSKAGQLSIVPPSYRSDLRISADIVEEIARIYGYHNLPSQLMATPLPQEESDPAFRVETQARHLLADLGWQEIYSYSLVSEIEAERDGYALAEHLKLQNPLKEENTYLRRSLIPSLLSIVENNPTQSNWQLFELARTYQPKKAALPEQELYLSLLSNQDYHQFRADLEIILNRLYILAGQGAELVVEEQTAKNHQIYQQSAKLVVIKGQSRQVLGNLHVLKNNLLAAEIKLSALIKVAKRYPHYQSLKNTSAVIEQLTFTIDKKVAIGELMRALKQVDRKIEEIKLLDLYQQNYTFELIYRDAKINLSNQDVEPIRQKVVAAAEKKFQAQLVGKV